MVKPSSIGLLALAFSSAFALRFRLQDPSNRPEEVENGIELQVPEIYQKLDHAADSAFGLTEGSNEVPRVGDIGKLPALGWNSWNAYGCDINEDKFLKAAEYTVKLGLKDAGYQYVNIDDCWSLMERNSTSKRMVPDLKKFPDGISGLAAKIHGMGLKFGIYSDAGDYTCQHYPGSLGYEDIDAATFAEWGVDYLKYDNCYVPKKWQDKCTYCLIPNSTCGTICPPDYDWTKSNSFIRYDRMRLALENQTRPILYSLCNQGQSNTQAWAGKVGHSWRSTDDIQPNWPSVLMILGLNAYGVDRTDFWGHSDPDMLEIGNGLNEQQERSHFALWAAMKSPLLIGTNLENIKPSSLAILKNKVLLAFNQDDQFGKPAKPFKWDGTFRQNAPPEFWSGRYQGGVLVLLLNKDGKQAIRDFSWEESPDLIKGKTYRIIDGWNGWDYGCYPDGVSVTNVKAYDTAVLILKDNCTSSSALKSSNSLPQLTLTGN